jgi:hypothetical protein
MFVSTASVSKFVGVRGKLNRVEASLAGDFNSILACDFGLVLEAPPTVDGFLALALLPELIPTFILTLAPDALNFLPM